MKNSSCCITSDVSVLWLSVLRVFMMRTMHASIVCELRAGRGGAAQKRGDRSISGRGRVA